MNTKLQDAVEIFKVLGWETVTEENVLQLPLGDAEQKKTALAGLKSGEWGEFAQINEHTYGWRSFISVDAGKLALFAIRVGVDAQRAASIAHGYWPLFTAVIARRGAKYAADFIKYACVSSRRPSEHSASAFGSEAVSLVDWLDLEIPQNVEYMKDWAVYAAAAMGLKTERFYNETKLPEADKIKRRFAEHMTAGVRVNTPATGPFGQVLPEGVKRGWLPRAHGLTLVFSALDAAVRPGDRKVWVQVLDALSVTDEEICARTQALIPLLALGESAVAARLAPVLISHAEGELLCEVLLAAFSATTKKTRQLVLKTALNRPCPENTEQLTPWLSMLAEASDQRTAALAEKLMKQWGIAAVLSTEEKKGIQGLWRKTPPIWNAPPFELGEASPEALTELAAKLVNQAGVVHDVTAERFLAMVNEVAKHDAEAARMSLRGLRKDSSLIDFVVGWVKQENPVYGFDVEGEPAKDPLHARDYMVSLHLGSLPCLLSTPSIVDLSVTVPDLTARLSLYEQAEAAVLESDLLLALTRLDIKTQTPETVKTLEKLTPSVVLQSGKRLSVTAGQAVLAYLKHPIKEPELPAESDYWSLEDLETVDSLAGFPNRFGSFVDELFSIFPLWGDYALRCVRWDSEVYHERGLILRQVARRAAPLPPGASINLLAAQRSMAPDAAGDSLRAVTDAWERGLLRPGAADIARLDWCVSPPSNLAALAAAFDGIVLDGMLSVVWPILDALTGASLKAPRLLAGTAELAERMEAYLPAVQSAVEEGLAENTSLHLPQIRALAKRGGTSRAVNAAQRVAALLPPYAEPPQQEEAAAPVMEIPFDEIWSVDQEARPPIEDGVAITVDFVDPGAPTKLLLFTLTLPGISDRIFQVVKGGWFYDMEREGQCRAYPAAPHTTGFMAEEKNQVWLHWDAAQKAMAVCRHRGWAEGKDGPRNAAAAPELSLCLLTVLIGLLAQDGDAKYYAPRLLKACIKRGAVGAELVRKATQVLLKSPAVSPAKLGRVLEKDIKLLPVLWPILTESIKHAGALAAKGDALPVWVNRILDISLRYAPYLAQAAILGLIPGEDAQWEGLSHIACAKSKSTAVAKAQRLEAVTKDTSSIFERDT